MHRRFELFTGSLLSGTYNLLTLSLPEGWAVHRTPSPPDIYYMGVVNGKRWILEGYATYFLVNEVTGDVYELFIEIKKLRNHKLVGTSGRAAGFAGHSAQITQKTYRRGLLRKTTVMEVVVNTVCDLTAREISINIVSPHTLPEEVLEAMRESTCH